jgi:hypothetical protein
MVEEGRGAEVVRAAVVDDDAADDDDDGMTDDRSLSL